MYQKLTEFREYKGLVCHLILLFCENKLLLLTITCKNITHEKIINRICRFINCSIF